MSLKNTSKIQTMAYTYLGYRDISHDPEIDKLIDECIIEVEGIAQFKYLHVEFDQMLDFLKDNKIYSDFLSGTNKYYFVLTTLGQKIDDRCRYYSKVDLKKMVVFDAVSSAYLEYMADEYEIDNFESERTYRFCPGYQGTSTNDLREIFKYFNSKYTGVNLLESNLMVPMKTMCGIIGFGTTKKKTCGNCALKEKCEYRRVGKTCY